MQTSPSSQPTATYWQPSTGSQLSVVQALPSSQFTGAYWQPRTASQLSEVHASASSQLTAAYWQPSSASQLSAVQALASLQSSGGPVHTPEAQAPPLHRLPSSQLVPLATGAFSQPVEGLQLSVVQTLASLQSSGGPPTQIPDWQVSAPLHTLPSAHEVPLATGVASQVSDPSLQMPSVHTVVAPVAVGGAARWQASALAGVSAGADVAVLAGGAVRSTALLCNRAPDRSCPSCRRCHRYSREASRPYRRRSGRSRPRCRQCRRHRRCRLPPAWSGSPRRDRSVGRADVAVVAVERRPGAAGAALAGLVPVAHVAVGTRGAVQHRRGLAAHEPGKHAVGRADVGVVAVERCPGRTRRRSDRSRPRCTDRRRRRRCRSPRRGVWQPGAGSQLSVVQTLPSSQVSGVPGRTASRPDRSRPRCRRSPSAHEVPFNTGAVVHPRTGSHAVCRAELPSSQVERRPGVHVPRLTGLVTVADVRRRHRRCRWAPSGFWHPEPGSQLSVVQTLPSSQVRGVPAVHAPSDRSRPRCTHRRRRRRCRPPRGVLAPKSRIAAVRRTDVTVVTVREASRPCTHRSGRSRRRCRDPRPRRRCRPASSGYWQPKSRIAAVCRADVPVVTVERRPGRTRPRLAGLVAVAHVPVRTGGAVRHRGFWQPKTGSQLSVVQTFASLQLSGVPARTGPALTGLVPVAHDRRRSQEVPSPHRGFWQPKSRIAAVRRADVGVVAVERRPGRTAARLTGLVAVAHDPRPRRGCRPPQPHSCSPPCPVARSAWRRCRWCRRWHRRSRRRRCMPATDPRAGAGARSTLGGRSPTGREGEAAVY